MFNKFVCSVCLRHGLKWTKMRHAYYWSLINLLWENIDARIFFTSIGAHNLATNHLFSEGRLNRFLL